MDIYRTKLKLKLISKIVVTEYTAKNIKTIVKRINTGYTYRTKLKLKLISKIVFTGYICRIKMKTNQEIVSTAYAECNAKIEEIIRKVVN